MQSADIVKVFDEEKKVGCPVPESMTCMPRLTFTPTGISSLSQIGIKYGHFYAPRILPCLPLEQESTAPEQGYAAEKGDPWLPEPESDGVVRISLAHYNTAKEVEEIVKVLKRVL